MHGGMATQFGPDIVKATTASENIFKIIDVPSKINARDQKLLADKNESKGIQNEADDLLDKAGPYLKTKVWKGPKLPENCPCWDVHDEKDIRKPKDKLSDEEIELAKSIVLHMDLTRNVKNVPLELSGV